MKEMNERSLLRLTRMLCMLECQKGKPQAGQHDLKAPQTNRAVGSFTGQKTGPPDTTQEAPDAQPLRLVLQKWPPVTFLKLSVEV